MGKKSHKQPPRSEEDSGCLSGFVSIFDFRIGHHSQKLLGNGNLRRKIDLPENFEIKHECIDDVDESREKMVSSRMASVKTLMEEEMSRTSIPNLPNDGVELLLSDLGPEINRKKNRKKKSKNHNAVPNINSDGSKLDPDQTNSPNPGERTLIDFELAAVMVKFYHDSELDPYLPLEIIDHSKHSHLDEPAYQIAQKHIILWKALGDIAQVFQSEKPSHAKRLSSNGTIQSRELMDALGTLNSNKDLLMKLIEDPNSILSKRIQDLQNAQIRSELLEEETSTSGQHEGSSQKQKRHLFRKKNKCKGGDNSQATSRIVVLKPSPARPQNASTTVSPSSSPQSHCNILKHQKDSQRTGSYFSFKEIKRRLGYVIGESKKERHPISMDVILHRIPYGFKDSGASSESLGSKSSCTVETTTQPSAISKKRDEKSGPIEIAHPLHDESLFYKEAKKYITGVLASEDQKDNFPTKEASKSLGRIASPPECHLSPQSSPGRDEEVGLSSQQMKASPLRGNTTNGLNTSSQSLDSTSCTDSNIGNETQPLDLSPVCFGEDSKTEGSIKIVGISSHACLEEHKDLSVLSESAGNESNIICEGCKEEGLLALEASNDEPQLAIPSASESPSLVLIQKLEDPECTLEKPERPSPVSVLEPMFLEDGISPERTTRSNHVDLSLQPQQIHFEEHESPLAQTSTLEGDPKTCSEEKEVMFDFVTTLLEASGFSCNAEKWHSPHHLIDPSLFDEVGMSYSLLPDESQILLDCINEVLVEIQERLFSCTPWVSLIQLGARPLLRQRNFIQEVCEGIHGHILRSMFPYTLDQVIGKDMVSTTWMELRSETEVVVTEMGETILEEIMEETLFEL